jgi:hypothetical protein
MNRVLVSIAFLACASGLVGCATTQSPAASKVKDADESMVVGCSYLGDVHGSSALDGDFFQTGMQNARTDAVEEAAKKGASHVVWNSSAGGRRPFVGGRAYRCP